MLYSSVHAARDLNAINSTHITYYTKAAEIVDDLTQSSLSTICCYNRQRQCMKNSSDRFVIRVEVVCPGDIVVIGL